MPDGLGMRQDHVVAQRRDEKACLSLLCCLDEVTGLNAVRKRSLQITA